MSSEHKKEQLAGDLVIQFRYASANFVMFSQAVADRVGIHSTDSECLDYLLLNGPATAGQLSELTGLTTGAITAVIDRLEKAGFVRREHGKEDRRKVMVVPNEKLIQTEIAPYSMAMGAGLVDICAEFSAEELETVLKFMDKANSLATTQIQKIRKKK